MTPPPSPGASAPASGLTGLTSLITQLTSLVASLTALVTAALALWNAVSAHQQSGIATSVAQQAAASTALQASLTTHIAAFAAPAPTAAPPASFFVQLATYQMKQCEIARQEIESYHGALSPQPSLWRDPTDRYVIIGAAVADRAQAEALQKAAQKLSQDPSQAGNDLANAIIRPGSPFQPLAACP